MTNETTPLPEPVAHLHDDGYWTRIDSEAGRLFIDSMRFAGASKVSVVPVSKVTDLLAAERAKYTTLLKEHNTLEIMHEECKMDWSGDVTQIKAEHKHEVDTLKALLTQAREALKDAYLIVGSDCLVTSKVAAAIEAIDKHREQS